jgi:hypothetical protein
VYTLPNESKIVGPPVSLPAGKLAGFSREQAIESAIRRDPFAMAAVT